MVYKHHGMVHMVHAMSLHGNAAYYSTHEDESENGEVAQIAQAAHMAKMAFTVLQRCVVVETHLR
eukprot:7278736-Pyramimonas_sp.AAC.1